MDFLLAFHSGWRYVILLDAVMVAIGAVANLRTGRVGDATVRLTRFFAIALDIQLLAGVALLVVRGFYPQLIGHIVMMVAAVAIAHLLAITLRKRPPDRRTPGLVLTGIAICLAMIVGGILAIGRAIV